MPPDPRTSPDGSPRVLAGPLSTTGFKGDSPALNPYKNGDRKITLNFALAPGEAIDASEMARIFSPEKFLIKITPVNPTQTADKNRVTHCWVDHIPGAVRESAAALGSKGFQVIVSPSMPDEIAAATSCGQLWSNALGERAAFLEENKRREEACYLTAQNLAEKMRIFSRGIEQFKRRNFSVSVDKAALLVVDMQEFFLSPASPAYLPAGRVILANVRQLANAFRGLGRPVYFTAHAHEDPRIDGGLMTLWWKKICLAGSSGARVIPFLEAKEGEIFTKCRYSAFTNPDLAAVLRERGVEELVIAGIMTNLCVESTARDAFDKDFKTWVVADATAAHSGELHLASLQNLAYGFSQIVTTADIAKELTPVNHYAKL
ncbi:MAG: cysteine hydrolase [Elusimicrobia bacterium]|nr:cysteine hydrolase [Elusimicrobiota bacterium]